MQFKCASDQWLVDLSRNLFYDERQSVNLDGDDEIRFLMQLILAKGQPTLRDSGPIFGKQVSADLECDEVVMYMYLSGLRVKIFQNLYLLALGLLPPSARNSLSHAWVL